MSLRRTPSAPNAQAPDAPQDRGPLVTWDVLHRFRQDHADMYGFYPYRRGLLVETLPVWLTIAADRGLHELESARDSWDECRHALDDEGFSGESLEAAWDPDHTEDVGWALAQQVPLRAGEGPEPEPPERPLGLDTSPLAWWAWCHLTYQRSVR